MFRVYSLCLILGLYNAQQQTTTTSSSTLTQTTPLTTANKPTQPPKITKKAEAEPEGTTTAKRPNIVFILAEDLVSLFMISDHEVQTPGPDTKLTKGYGYKVSRIRFRWPLLG